MSTIFHTFYVHGSVHGESMPIIVQQDATIYSFIIFLQTAQTLMFTQMVQDTKMIFVCHQQD